MDISVFFKEPSFNEGCKSLLQKLCSSISFARNQFMQANAKHMQSLGASAVQPRAKAAWHTWQACVALTQGFGVQGRAMSASRNASRSASSIWADTAVTARARSRYFIIILIDVSNGSAARRAFAAL